MKETAASRWHSEAVSIDHTGSSRQGYHHSPSAVVYRIREHAQQTAIAVICIAITTRTDEGKLALRLAAGHALPGRRRWLRLLERLGIGTFERRHDVFGAANECQASATNELMKSHVRWRWRWEAKAEVEGNREEGRSALESAREVDGALLLTFQKCSLHSRLCSVSKSRIVLTRLLCSLETN